MAPRADQGGRTTGRRPATRSSPATCGGCTAARSSPASTGPGSGGTRRSSSPPTTSSSTSTPRAAPPERTLRAASWGRRDTIPPRVSWSGVRWRAAGPGPGAHGRGRRVVVTRDRPGDRRPARARPAQRDHRHAARRHPGGRPGGAGAGLLHLAALLHRLHRNGENRVGGLRRGRRPDDLRRAVEVRLPGADAGGDGARHRTARIRRRGARHPAGPRHPRTGPGVHRGGAGRLRRRADAGRPAGARLRALHPLRPRHRQVGRAGVARSRQG